MQQYLHKNRSCFDLSGPYTVQHILGIKVKVFVLCAKYARFICFVPKPHITDKIQSEACWLLGTRLPIISILCLQCWGKWAPTLPPTSIQCNWWDTSYQERLWEIMHVKLSPDWVNMGGCNYVPCYFWYVGGLSQAYIPMIPRRRAWSRYLYELRGMTSLVQLALPRCPGVGVSSPQ